MRIKKVMSFLFIISILFSVIIVPVKANTSEKKLVLYYSFKDVNGYTVINGASTGSKYNGAIVGNASISAEGKLGKALKINGEGLGGSFAGEENVSRVEIPADILKEFKNGATFSFLIKPERIENSVIMTTGYWNDQNLGFINFWLSHSIVSSEGPHFAYQSYSSADSSERDHLKTTQPLKLNEWQWLTFTIDDKRNATLYIDGTAIGSTQFGYDIIDLADGLDFDYNDIISIGSSSIFPDDDGGNFLVDEVYMYNYALSASEVKSLSDTKKERESEAVKSPDNTPDKTPNNSETTQTPEPEKTDKSTPARTPDKPTQTKTPEATAKESGTNNNSSNTVLFIIIGVVVVLALGTGGFFTYKKIKNRGQ